MFARKLPIFISLIRTELASSVKRKRQIQGLFPAVMSSKLTFFRCEVFEAKEFTVENRPQGAHEHNKK